MNDGAAQTEAAAHGYCATCCHWEPQDPLGSRAVVPCGDLMAYDTERPDGIPRRGWGICRMTQFESFGGGGYLHPKSLALSTDHEDYAAELLTRPEFGCVQWQPKEGTD